MELDQAIQARRSVRSFGDEPIGAAALARLLASAQGVTGDAPHLRAVPSAGALHPLEVYVVAGRVEALPSGVYHYRAEDGSIEPQASGDLRPSLMRAALGQGVVAEAPLCLVVAAEYERTTRTYGSRGRRYVHMEVGHVAQNLSLTAVALGLGTVSIGAFSDDEVKRVLGIPWEPLLIMPVGHPAEP